MPSVQRNVNQNSTISFVSNQESTGNKEFAKDSHNISFKSPGKASQDGFCYYLGIMLLSPWLNRLKDYGLEILSQWLVVILLGVKNIEQTKTLDYQSLQVLSGPCLSNLHAQRKLLRSSATTENINKLRQLNTELAGARSCTDFYYDPHVKHYTGELKILKGWCSKVRRADKVLQMDFIHTTDGFPVYCATQDNYDDLRQRYPAHIEAFRTLAGIPDAHPLTFVVDRAIFAFGVFDTIIETQNQHIITWEKGYKQDGWDPKAPVGYGSMVRPRNNSRDLKEYKFSYQDKMWEKKDKIRKLVVSITNPKKRTIEVSILTDDLDRQPEQIITLMFSRWIQENDFRYLIKHFGINEITSYRWFSYKELEDVIEDKKAVCGQYKALQSEISALKKQLKTALLKAHIYDRKIAETPDFTPMVKQKQDRQKTAQQIKNLTAQLQDKEAQRQQTQKLTSKLQILIDKEYQRLDTDTKTLMDMLKIIARNIFYLALQPFKKSYDNYRDDHVIFRNLTHANGKITFLHNSIHIALHPTMHYPPKLKMIIQQTLKQINEMQPTLPNGSDRKINIVLADKINSFFAIAN